MTKSDIHKLLQKTFRSHPPPTGDDLAPKGLDAGTAMRLREKFAERKWFELDPEFVVEQSDLLWSMAPAAQRYYLPAFLLATFHAPKDWVYADNLILGLFLPLRSADDDPARENFIQFLENLEPQEKSAVRSFLDYMSQHHPSKGEQGAAKMALRVLWRKFDAAA